jgi:hypothetical protein
MTYDLLDAEQFATTVVTSFSANKKRKNNCVNQWAEIYYAELFEKDFTSPVFQPIGEERISACEPIT